MKKIKKHFKNAKVLYNYKGREVFDYPYLRSDCIKIFSTLNESKQAFKLNEDEYRNLYKIRAKRNRNGLPKVYDDYPTEVYYLSRSWKHSSKRSKQWYK